MEILKVTSETEYLAIHYSCSEDVRPMIDQIQWTKDEIPLRLNSTKYNGGGVKDKYLKILSPAREDGGEYVYTIFNAWGSVRESITLGVPTAQLPQCLKIPFGSPVSIEPVIQSCPPVMKVVWEMSKDQNPENFKALDVTCSRYFGSTLDPQNPIFVIPKVSNADRMYYRIQVLNGIGNSWSNATLLKIHGDIPSVFINHETNFSERRVSLLCEIVLTKNSPGVETILWIKDKKPLDISGCGLKYSGGTVSDPTLTINAVNSNDSGEYQCNVSNAVGNMSSSPIYLGVPSIEIHSPGLEHDEEGEKLIFTCTVRSIPEATIVEWGIQQSPEDVFRKIDVHDPMYIGSTVSMPYPVLMVHKYYQTSSQIYLIKVTNYIGETTEVIQDS
ncbi:titin-like [Saccostrea echinata]|uniref:titin-like n=1 Tax=Saccostrea echinata TaxID=191078 RepID=UPI002A7EC1E2|nr:titin-like [Saccostrea echinata]